MFPAARCPSQRIDDCSLRVLHNRPGTAILLSAFLWGTWWIPLRYMDASGGGGVWILAASFLLPLPVLAVVAMRFRGPMLKLNPPLAAAGCLVAVSVVLYAEGFLRGNVARVILLFYLTPVWSTLLGRWMLGEPITGRRVATIILGLSGLYVIFNQQDGPLMPHDVAEWMALLSGFCWALGMVYMRRTRRQSFLGRAFWVLAFAGAWTLVMALAPGGREWDLPTVPALTTTLGWLLATAFLWTLPVVWLTTVGGSGLDPGRVAILLLFEVVVGLVSAALLAGEIIGPREWVGAVLILVAGALGASAETVSRDASKGAPPHDTTPRKPAD